MENGLFFSFPDANEKDVRTSNARLRIERRFNMNFSAAERWITRAWPAYDKIAVHLFLDTLLYL